MSPDEARAYAERHGLSAASDDLILRIAALAATVAEAGRAIPRSGGEGFEPAATFTVHLPKAEPTR